MLQHPLKISAMRVLIIFISFDNYLYRADAQKFYEAAAVDRRPLPQKLSNPKEYGSFVKS